MRVPPAAQWSSLCTLPGESRQTCALSGPFPLPHAPPLQAFAELLQLPPFPITVLEAALCPGPLLPSRKGAARTAGGREGDAGVPSPAGTAAPENGAAAPTPGTTGVGSLSEVAGDGEDAAHQEVQSPMKQSQPEPPSPAAAAAAGAPAEPRRPSRVVKGKKIAPQNVIRDPTIKTRRQIIAEQVGVVRWAALRQLGCTRHRRQHAAALPRLPCEPCCLPPPALQDVPNRSTSPAAPAPAVRIKLKLAGNPAVATAVQQAQNEHAGGRLAACHRCQGG